MEIAVLLLAYERLNALDDIFDKIRSYQVNQKINVFINVDFSPSQHNRAVKSYLRSLDGIEVQKIWFSTVNQGLKKSVLQSLSEVFISNDAVIVVEDDLQLKEGFFEYMVESLHYYNDNKEVFTISGYSSFLHNVSETLFSRRLSSWGWAIWKDRYEGFLQTNVNTRWCIYERNFWKLLKGGSDVLRLRRLNRIGKIDSWAIEFLSYQLTQGLASVYPPVSFVKNVGFDEFATHSQYVIEESVGSASFNPNILLYRDDIRFYRKLLEPFSLLYRIRKKYLARTYYYSKLVEKMPNIARRKSSRDLV